jgi:AcrR family transcriptional regulator
MPRKTVRPYQSQVRQRQADDTRRRIAEASRVLLERKGYAGTTIEAIAQEARVAPQTVYAVFGSKTGILLELVDQATFGPDYQDLVRQAVQETKPEERLRFAARIARTIYDAQSSTFDLLRGAGVVAPALERLQKERECQRFERQKVQITYLIETGQLKPGLDLESGREILWALTGRELYRMLVRERGWSSQKYEDWLGDLLGEALLAKPKVDSQPIRNTKSVKAKAGLR